MADEDNKELRDPTIGLKDKLNRHIDRKRNLGIMTHAQTLNTIIPWYFLFVYVGASFWDIMIAVPFHHHDDIIRLVLVEIFFTYVVIQLFINWLLVCYTTSPYIPDASSTTASHHQAMMDMSGQRDDSNGMADQQNCDANTQEDETPSTMISSQTNNPRERTGMTYRVMVVTKVTGSTPHRESMPYWSWVPCYTCRRPRPPRCHHCPICNHCVLKRDHHCYFTRNCIGVSNQRFFIYYLFWCVVLCTASSCQLFPFLFNEVLPLYSFWDLVFPINLISVFTGNLPALCCHLIWVSWGVLFLTFIAYGMLGNAIYLMLKGVTYFESTAGIKIIDTRSSSGRIRSVMGSNWVVGLFVPLIEPLRSRLPPSIMQSDPEEDAVNWPYIKP